VALSYPELEKYSDFQRIIGKILSVEVLRAIVVGNPESLTQEKLILEKLFFGWLEDGSILVNKIEAAIGNNIFSLNILSNCRAIVDDNLSSRKILISFFLYCNPSF
jgi:hypothetical protein